jgi:hypothetical protein
MFAGNVFIVGGGLRNEGALLEQSKIIGEVLSCCKLLNISEKSGARYTG